MSVIFNDIDLEEIAPVKYDDIRVSPIIVTPVARQRPINFGQEFVRLTGSNRTVVITFALLEQDNNARYQALNDITAWARVGEEHSLSLPMMEGWHLNAVCTGFPEPSYRLWWENKLRLTFTTFDDPFWINDNETSVSFGQEFTVGGNAPPLMRFERTLTSTESNKSYTGDNGEDMLFSTIPAGNLVIDLNRQTCVVSGTSIAQYLTPTSEYITPRVGTQKIKGAGRIIYRERRY